MRKTRPLNRCRTAQKMHGPVVGSYLPAQIHEPVVQVTLTFTVACFFVYFVFRLDVAVHDEQHSCTFCGYLGIVGDEHYGSAFVVELGKLFHDFVGRCAVERTCGLICEYHLW